MRCALGLLSCAMMMCLCNTVCCQEGDTSDGINTSAAVSAMWFQKGKTWRRTASVPMGIGDMKPRTGKVVTDYQVVEGYVDGKCATEQITIEVTIGAIEVTIGDRRIPKENNPFRLVLEKNGRYKCIMFRRGDTWHEFGKVPQPKEPAVVVIMNATFNAYHVFLPLPLEWKDASLSFPTNIAGRASVETTVRGDQLTLTCKIEKYRPASEQTTAAGGEPPAPVPIVRTFHLVYEKGDPWPVEMSSDLMEGKDDVFRMKAREDADTPPKAETPAPTQK